jgi:hypothetical protein
MHLDFVIVGSGLGGSVSALRWLWMPRLGFRGPFEMTFLRHLTAPSGVGGGSPGRPARTRPGGGP